MNATEESKIEPTPSREELQAMGAGFLLARMLFEEAAKNLKKNTMDERRTYLVIGGIIKRMGNPSAHELAQHLQMVKKGWADGDGK